VVRSEKLIEFSYSWFSAKTLKVVRLFIYFMFMTNSYVWHTR